MNRKTVITIAALIGIQAILYAAWWAVESGKEAPTDAPITASPTTPRTTPRATSEASPGAPPKRGGAEVKTTRMELALPGFEVRRPDGATSPLPEAFGPEPRPRILHIWATWCPPCREELPSLFAYGDSGAVDVLAVGVDPDWKKVRELLGQTPRDEVVLASAAEVQAALDVNVLPVTFVVSPDGTIRLRLDGARDWADPELRRQVEGR